MFPRVSSIQGFQHMLVNLLPLGGLPMPERLAQALGVIKRKDGSLPGGACSSPE